jgi:hypothetical protein
VSGVLIRFVLSSPEERPDVRSKKKKDLTDHQPASCTEAKGGRDWLTLLELSAPWIKDHQTLPVNYGSQS